MGKLRLGRLSDFPKVTELVSSKNSNFLASNSVLLDIEYIDPPNINFFPKILQLAILVFLSEKN